MNFDISRLRRSDQVIGAGAIALLIFLFVFKWYGVSSSASIGGVSFSSSANGWHSFTNSRWIWLITIIVGLGAVGMKAAERELQLPVQKGVIVAALGALSTILILYRIIHHPTAGASGTIAGVHYSASAGIKIGIWLALIAAAAITYGGYLAMGDEGTSLADVREQASSAFSGLAAATSTGSAGSEQGSAPAAAPPIPPPGASEAPAEPPGGSSSST